MISPRFFDLAVWQLVQLSILIVTVGSLARLACQRYPALAHSLWLVVLLKSLTPPLWSCPTGIFTWAAKSLRNLAVAERPLAPIAPLPHLLIAHSFGSQTLPSAVSQHAATWQPWQVALAIWLGGTLIVLLSVLILSILTARKIARLSVPPPPGLAELLQSTAGTLGFRRPPKLCVCREPIGPAVFGIFKHVLVLPESIVACNNRYRLSLIIAHEILHIRRGDPFVAAAQLLSGALWWFNPLIWWMNRQINQTREMCCDSQVIAHLRCPTVDYAQVLIDVLRLRRTFKPIPLTLGIQSSQVTVRRLGRIIGGNIDLRPQSFWKHLLLICTVALFVLPGAALLSPAVADQPQTQPADPNQSLYDFLGQPVQPPPNLDFAYTKQGLINAIQLAAQNARITLTRVQIDDSEFPFLVGVVIEKGGFSKLRDQLWKLPGYTFLGSVDEDTCAAMDIIPKSVVPRGDSERAYHRLGVRLQILFRKIDPHQSTTTSSSKPASQP